MTSNSSRKVPLLFAVTIFLGSGLLFLVQPMIAKAILPLAGGTPAVWNTCVFFFQTVLLLGYGYGMLLTTRLRHGQQNSHAPDFIAHGRSCEFVVVRRHCRASTRSVELCVVGVAVFDDHSGLDRATAVSQQHHPATLVRNNDE